MGARVKGWGLQSIALCRRSILRGRGHHGEGEGKRHACPLPASCVPWGRGLPAQGWPRAAHATRTPPRAQWLRDRETARTGRVWLDHDGPRPLAFARPIPLPAPRNFSFFRVATSAAVLLPHVVATAPRKNPFFQIRTLCVSSCATVRL
jgi:hypothetical protein